MAGLPHFYTPYPPSLPPPTAGGQSKFSQTYARSHTHTHTCIPAGMHMQTHTLHPDHFIINPIPFFWTFFFFLLFFSPASSSLLFCFAPDKPLFHIVALGAEGQPLFTSTSQLIRALYLPEGKRCGLKLCSSEKPAGCQQTSICKLGLRNVCLLTKRKSSGAMCFSVCFSVRFSVCAWKTQDILCAVRWAGPHTASLVAQGTDAGHWNLDSPSHLLNSAGGLSFLLHLILGPSVPNPPPVPSPSAHPWRSA